MWKRLNVETITLYTSKRASHCCTTVPRALICPQIVTKPPPVSCLIKKWFTKWQMVDRDMHPVSPQAAGIDRNNTTNSTYTPPTPQYKLTPQQQYHLVSNPGWLRLCLQHQVGRDVIATPWRTHAIHENTPSRTQPRVCLFSKSHQHLPVCLFIFNNYHHVTNTNKPWTFLNYYSTCYTYCIRFYYYSVGNFTTMFSNTLMQVLNTWRLSNVVYVHNLPATTKNYKRTWGRVC